MTAMTVSAGKLSNAWIAILALVLAFAFLGSRGLWDPDEGRYTNVALTMLDSGNWLDPMRNEDTGHWSKPPVTYWLVAASVSVFGRNEFAARLPSALAYLLCIALAWRCARRLAPGAEAEAALIYATMILPYCAGQLVTTDFPMTAAQTLAVYAFVEHRFGTPGTRWVLLMWAAFALAFMTKGPPALLPLAPIMALQWLAPSGQRRKWLAHAAGVLIFLALVLPWFIAVSLRHQGLLGYFLGAEVVDRVSSDRFRRNGQWYGWAVVYVPTLAVGALPWLAPAGRWAWQLPSQLRAWSTRMARQAQARGLFVALWLLLPLLAFCIARSRLPLYLLPVFVPLALAIAAQRQHEQRQILRLAWLLAWLVLMVLLRAVAAQVPSRQDESAWADAIRSRVSTPISEVVFVEDSPRYGLHLYLGTQIESLSLAPLPQSRFNPKYDEPLIRELEEAGEESGLVYVARQELWPELQRRIAGYGYSSRQFGASYRGRVIFEVNLPANRQPAEAAAPTESR